MEDPIMVQLEVFLRESNAVEKLSPVIERLLGELRRSPCEPQAWAPLPDAFLGAPLIQGIASCWVFALRANGRFPSERHPNSWQRSLAVRGSALFEVYEDSAWRPHALDASSRQTNSVSIPPNFWHRIAIGPETFVSLSFHTARATELIEETCEGDDFTKTQQRLYHG